MASRPLLALPVIVAALALGACGSEGIQLAEDDPNYEGAPTVRRELRRVPHARRRRRGSATDVGSRELRDGPNFNERKETVEDVLYAIRNGGFSSQPMPQNIVTGEDAQKVAEFVAKYSVAVGGESDSE